MKLDMPEMMLVRPADMCDDSDGRSADENEGPNSSLKKKCKCKFSNLIGLELNKPEVTDNATKRSEEKMRKVNSELIYPPIIRTLPDVYIP